MVKNASAKYCLMGSEALQAYGSLAQMMDEITCDDRAVPGASITLPTGRV